MGGPIKRSEYEKALAEFNAKYGDTDKELAKIKKEIYDIKKKAMADGRTELARDVIDGSYYNDAKLTPEEQDEVNALWNRYSKLSSAKYHESENLRKMLKQVKDYEAAVRRVGREVPNADRLTPNQIEEYQVVSKKIQAAKREIGGLEHEIERVTRENTARIEELKDKLVDLDKQLKAIVSEAEYETNDEPNPNLVDIINK